MTLPWCMVQFSKEPNNLYNVNSYKHSRLANKKSVTIRPGGKHLSVVLATTKTKKQNKPGSLYHRSVVKEEFCKMARVVMNQVEEDKSWQEKEGEMRNSQGKLKKL